MSGALNGIAKNVGPQILGGMSLPPNMGGMVSAVLQEGAIREKFVAVLLASAGHASKKTHFNLETEINDLLVRLGNLRQTQQSGGMFGNVGAAAAGLSSSANLMPSVERVLQDLINGVIRR